jgi:transmembrane sensor
MTDPRKPLSGRLDEAVVWHVRLGSDQADERTWLAFTSWLESDEANRTAFDEVEDFTGGLESSVAMARGSKSLANIGPARFPPRVRSLLRSPYAWAATATALAAVALLFIFLPLEPRQPASVTYSTRMGETRSVALPDGTVVDLNTGTMIRVRVGRSERRVALDRGQALFHVAKDSRHPFDVSVGSRVIRVVGTVFDVLRNDGTITVTVAEGKVGVFQPDAQAGPGFTLVAGDQVAFVEATGKATLRRVNPSVALAWRSGYLVYQNAPLAMIVSDINRYFARRVAIGDGSAAAQRFSGVLRMDREDAVLRRLSRLLPVEADYRADGGIVLRTPKHRD